MHAKVVLLVKNTFVEHRLGQYIWQVVAVKVFYGPDTRFDQALLVDGAESIAARLQFRLRLQAEA